MTSFYRDMAILAVAVVAGVLWSLYSLVTRRGHRLEVQERARVQAGQDAKRAPIPGLPELAATEGWTGPTTDLPGEQLAADCVRRMLGNIWGFSTSTIASADVRVDGPLYANLYSGKAGARAFVIGNVWMSFGAKDCPGSLCVLHLDEALPPLFVNLRRYQPFMRFGMREMTFEGDAFNQRFRVMAANREYASDAISERTMELLMARDDWVFALEFDRLICLAKDTLSSADDYVKRVDAVSRFADLIPRFVADERALKMPTLPDGTTLDLEDPASRQKFGEALMAMAPEERERFLAQARVQGAGFLAGMFGKELSPEVEERLEEGIADDHAEKDAKHEG